MDSSFLFAPKYFREISRNFNLSETPNLEHKKERVEAWQNSIRNKTILQDSEIQLQTDFLNLFFRDVLDYSPKIGNDNWNLDSEFAISTGKRADGYLGYFTPNDKDIRVVIELKDARTDLDRKQNRKDSQTPVEQAFSYAHKVGTSCKWVILSNFREIRLYPADDSNRYESFDILKLNEVEELTRFLFLLHKDRLIFKQGESSTERHYRLRQEREQTISKEFYAKFKKIRAELFQHLKEHNPAVEEFTLFSKAQKILDRMIFVFFCEDMGMLPYKITRKVVEAGSQSFSISDDNIWQQLKGLFNSIDKGNPPHNINSFNGGLFASDSVLDNLTIKDSTLKEILELETYDFESELNVNILGHIFEQSISDIEEIKAEIAGDTIDAKQGKRKKDGIFYTPEYITRYIVKEAVGGWLEDRKQELGIDTLPELSEDDYKTIKFTKGKIKGNKKIELHRQFWASYREKLSDIKVVDPACGSGAFLVQVFDFLFQEGQMVNREIARLNLGQTSTEDLHKHILSNNIYGVDLNPESVEITKLSLWLKTADKQKELTALDENILCGNSLIDDPEIAGERAFNWKERFKGIFDSGGFDVVVGNPPYATRNLDSKVKDFINKEYEVAQYQVDLYTCFNEKGIKILTDNGVISYITPNSWLKNLRMNQCRDFMLRTIKFTMIIPNLENVFPDASVDTLIFVGTKKQEPIEESNIKIMEVLGTQIYDKHFINQKRFELNDNKIFDVEISDSILPIFDKIRSAKFRIGDIFEVTRGVNPYDKYRGQSQEVIKSRAYHSSIRKDDSFVPELKGKHIERYLYNWDENHFISYGDWLAAPRDPKFFNNERIIFREILGTNFVVTIISEPFIIDRSLYIALPLEEYKEEYDIYYVLAILASKLMAFYFRYSSNEFDNLFPKIRLAEFKALPIKLPSPLEKASLGDKAKQIINLKQTREKKSGNFTSLMKSEFLLDIISNKMQSWYNLTFPNFQKELKKSKVTLNLKQKAEWMEYFEEEKAKVQAIQAEIEKTDKEIDRMVYELYGLTEEEIRIVEG